MTTYIPFKKFGRLYPGIFHDFITGSNNKLKNFLPATFFDRNSFENHIRSLEPAKLNQVLVQDLLEYNYSLNADKHVLDDISKLLTGAYVVVTGQQPHIYGGPLYILYKIYTSILVRDYISKVTGKPAVCIFWNHSDDDNMESFTNITVLDKQQNPVRLKLELNDKDRRPAYLYRDIVNLARFNSKIWDITAPTENFKEMIKSCMKANFSRFFSNVIMKLFSKEGLILVEPRILSYDLTNEFYDIIFANPKEIINAFNDCLDELKSAEINTGLSRTNSPGLYMVDGNYRSKIYFENNKMYYNGTEITGTTADINTYFKRITTSFFTRPLLQDFLFNTCVYVAGPNEIVYNCALKYLYDIFRIQRPILFPRVSATLAFENLDKQMAESLPTLLKTATTNIEDFRLADTLFTFTNDIGEFMLKGRYKSELTGIKKLCDQLTNKISARKNNELDSLVKSLFPFEHLQERSLSYVGIFQDNFELQSKLKDMIDPFRFEHQLINI